MYSTITSLPRILSLARLHTLVSFLNHLTLRLLCSLSYATCAEHAHTRSHSSLSLPFQCTTRSSFAYQVSAMAEDAPGLGRSPQELLVASIVSEYSLNRRSFVAYFGVSPQDAAVLIERAHLTRREFLCTMHFLKVYPTEDVAQALIRCGRSSWRSYCKSGIAKIVAIKDDVVCIVLLCTIVDLVVVVVVVGVLVVLVVLVVVVVLVTSSRTACNSRRLTLNADGRDIRAVQRASWIQPVAKRRWGALSSGSTSQSSTMHTCSNGRPQLRRVAQTTSCGAPARM